MKVRIEARRMTNGTWSVRFHWGGVNVRQWGGLTEDEARAIAAEHTEVARATPGVEVAA